MFAVMSTPPDHLTSMIRALHDPGAYPHPVDRVEHRETHISHVLLAGEFAYKIKKPLDLGFLDFSTPERRAHYCAEEIRLNGRLAPGIYVDVVTVNGTPEHPRISGGGPVIEHAVRMRRFDDSRRLDLELARGAVDAATVRELAIRIADFHEHGAASDPPEDCGTPHAVIAPMRENFAQLRDAGDVVDDRAALDWLSAWTDDHGRALEGTLRRRLEQGRVRECHGDLHLGNIVRHEGGIEVFDGIEFNRQLRWIDVASDLAFLLMDLDRLDAPQLAGHALDAWLAHTGDYEALAVLRFYLVYRALVRAKIHAIRALQADDSALRDETRSSARAHLALAARYARSYAPALILTRGVAGTGKSSAASRLVERIGAVRLRSDVERLRLYPDAPPAVRYSEAASDAVHARLEALAAAALACGWPVVVDATFIERRRRAPFLALAERLRIPARILDLRVSPEVRDARIRARAASGHDASEANTAVAAAQDAAVEPLDIRESRIALVVDNDGDAPVVPPTELAHARGVVAS